ncbi:hypothetical protein Godav_016950 [Gossypium davidsonii]|uniref:Uncharacterized protein n=1 Tax=Gossypium davidsonii TaxID=34287 RepID=A0A7J8QRZ2_GOSDV|nr:hypothetical protein [Gossypium davidsonii]
MSIPTHRPLPNESWDCTLPGPPSRNNFGSADLNPSGLLAFASGSSVSVVDSRSLQLVASIPLPPSSSSLSPFVTSVRWTPLPLGRDLLSTEPSSSHLILAAADRHGRIALLDFRLRSLILSIDPPDPSSKSGIQDLCWVQARSDSFHLASISGPSYFSLYNTSTSRCIFKYDASPEYLSCIRRDPFDSRHLCIVGLKGFLLSIKVLGEKDDDVALKELQIRTDCTELLKLEKDAAAAAGGTSSSPASAVFPLYAVRLAFSPLWKNVIYVTFPRELVVFDLKYETTLFSAPLPRGCAKFLDVLPDPNQELVYCAHLDGKISIWRRKEGEQVHVMCTMEELMPSLGSPVPSPSVLAVLVSQSESTLHNISKLYSDSSNGASDVDSDNPFEFCDDTLLVAKTRLFSISDDGKLWSWILTAEGDGVMQKDAGISGNIANVSLDSTNTTTIVSTKDVLAAEGSRQLDNINGSRTQLPNSTFGFADVTFKISLVGQLQVLSSTVTMLAVPSPSLTATMSRGGDNPAITVPLVALGSQSGTIDVIDVSTNAVASSFSVHNSMVRGLRWLGNSRLVSFSYTQVNEKTGGYINRLVVTCLRSGLNRTFRVLQKPERAPIRALRTSSSGRYLLILFRDAPVEVWAMTKNPIMVSVMLNFLFFWLGVFLIMVANIPRPVQKGPSRESSLSHKDNKAVAPEVATSSTIASSSDSKAGNSENLQDEISESFAFALVNGALGVFEVHGRRIRDFRYNLL